MSVIEISNSIFKSIWIPALLLCFGLDTYSLTLNRKKQLQLSVFTSVIYFYFCVSSTVFFFGDGFPEGFYGIVMYLSSFFVITMGLLMLCGSLVMLMNYRPEEKIEKEKTKEEKSFS